MMEALPALGVLAGCAVVASALQTAIRTFLLPQPGLSFLSRTVFRTMRPLFAAIDRLPFPPARRQAWASVYAPLCLVLIVFVTMVVISLGYTLILYGLGLPTLQAAFLASISAISTLGFATVPEGLVIPIVATLETMTGIFIVALLIGYLPTIYAAVQQREQAVAALVAHVGTPLSGQAILLRYARSPGLAHLDELWSAWHRWFAALETSHNTLAGIIFVRSPQPERSWVSAAGAVLDAAALAVSTLEPPGDAGAEHCLEIGGQALRQVLDGARPLLTPRARDQEDRLQVTQSAFEAVAAGCAAAGLPVVANRTAAWQDFAQWRGTYEALLLALGRLTQAEVAPLAADGPSQHDASPRSTTPGRHRSRPGRPG
jgi:hypothetical protein